MLVSELLTKVRVRIRDIDAQDYTNDALLGFTNDAILLLGTLLVSQKKPEMLVDLNLTTASTAKPSNFIKFNLVYPVQVTASNLICYGELPCAVQYFKFPTLVTSVSDSVPFSNPAYFQVLEQIIAMYALNKNGFDVNFEKALSSEILTMITSI